MAVTPEQMTAALRERLETTFPDEPVYESLPEEPVRPGNLVELVKLVLDGASLGHGAVELLYQYRITTFCGAEGEPARRGQTTALRAMLLLGTFAKGYVKAGDRAPKVTACAADAFSADSAAVTLTLALHLDRSEFDPAELLPLMRELSLHIKTNEEDTP